MSEVDTQNSDADRREITELLYTYARGVDAKDWTVWKSVFTPDADIDHSSLTGVIGNPETASGALEAGLATAATTLHYVTNVTIELRSDTAKVDALYFAVVKFVDVVAPLYSGGIYQHDVVRTADGWRSRGLTVRPTWFDQRET